MGIFKHRLSDWDLLVYIALQKKDLLKQKVWINFCNIDHMNYHCDI